MSILKIILTAVLRFFWDRAEEIYKREVRYQRNKRVILNQVKEVAREAADRNDRIAVTRESVDDSLMRLDRFRVRRESQPAVSPEVRIDGPVFGDAFKRRAGGDSGGDQSQLPDVPGSDAGSDSGDQGPEQPGAESVGARPDDSLPTT